jgi:hypothetical protein
VKNNAEKLDHELKETYDALPSSEDWDQHVLDSLLTRGAQVEIIRSFEMNMLLPEPLIDSAFLEASKVSVVFLQGNHISASLGVLAGHQ